MPSIRALCSGTAANASLTSSSAEVARRRAPPSSAPSPSRARARCAARDSGPPTCRRPRSRRAARTPSSCGLLLAHHDDGGAPVGDLRGVARGHRPVGGERGPQRRRVASGRVGADALVALEADRGRPCAAGPRRARPRPPSRPLAHASCARACERAAHASCSSRVMPSSALIASVPSPMCRSSNAHHRPSWIMESSISVSPSRAPSARASAGRTARSSSTPCRRPRRRRARPRGSSGRRSRSPTCPTGRPC